MGQVLKFADTEEFGNLKHDIKNQLSNIQLSLEGLKYETDTTNPDLKLYLDSITQSAKKIDELLNNIE
ncbi:histidine kinase dimerization/phospho-acceptor domain-containing protein [Mucilaginibacter sp.]|uniref:histidine kinase dimerization/phospho-acceptor domain-containing protein n=1 Tax=Mucilaginibacter sp. TaxID=1882438 RepID=UPI0035BC2A98